MTLCACEQTDLGDIKLLLQSLCHSHQASVVLAGRGGACGLCWQMLIQKSIISLLFPTVNSPPHVHYGMVCAVWSNYKIGHVLLQEMYC